jgi:ABC-type Fe3+-hydroxamate transport system substrate-binding protein
MHLGLKQTLTVTLVALLSSLPGWSEQGTVVKPKRIVSLAPSVTETLFALGAGEQLVGICTFCDFPHEVERIDRIGSYIAPNVEAIVAKAPDVVIGVPPNSPEAVAALRRAGLKVVIVQVDTIEQIETAMRTIAHEAGRDAQGEALLAELRQHMAAVRARLEGAPQRRVLMVVGQNPLIAVGSGIFLNELITQARGRVNLPATQRSRVAAGRVCRCAVCGRGAAHTAPAATACGLIPEGECSSCAWRDGGVKRPYALPQLWFG